MKIVIDTNDFISALIGKKHRDKLYLILSDPSIEVFADTTLISEIREVAYREKFRKYITTSEVDVFIDVLSLRLTFIAPHTSVSDCKDPDDNYLLSLCIDSQSDYLVTGDKQDLISLNPYKGIKIIRLQELLDIIFNGGI